MKKIIISLVVLFTFTGVFAQGVEFEHGTLEEALVKAQKENKIVFMDCYTTWCGPCKYLVKKVFSQKEVGDFFNKNFVNLKMDMESEAGKPLLGKYDVSAFPTLLWLDTDGNIQHKRVGGGDVKEILATAKTAVDLENNWGALNKKFEAGERSPAFLQNFILISSKAWFDTKEAAKAYYSTKKLDQLINAKDMELIECTVESTSDSKFLFVLKNKEKFYAVSDKTNVDRFIGQTISSELWKVMETGDESAIAAKKEEILSLDKEFAPKIIASAELRMLYEDPDRMKYYQGLANFSIKYLFDNSEGLNKCARNLAEAKEELSKDIVNKALKMVKRSIELNANFANIDTYACLLNKAGLKEEATVQAKKSIELAPEDQKEGLWSSTFIVGK